MPPFKSRVHDFWRVNSYGYPCYFSDSPKAQEAWQTLLSFYDFKNYDKLKLYWGSGKAPRKISSHAVESWKSTFEEFGLVYVETASNTINITPAGTQFREAADRNDEGEFAWIGINLLMRYPLKGPRRPKSATHRDSDLLLYRFLYAAILDLDGYFWWSELERILCRIFHVSESEAAIQDIRQLRADPTLISAIDLPVTEKAGAFYNSLNQVAVHAGMNHLLLGSDDQESPYGDTESKRRHYVHADWLGMIRHALGGNSGSELCSSGGLMVARLPSAPSFDSEASYFEYLGAVVDPLSKVKGPAISTVDFQGEKVWILEKGNHYQHRDAVSIIGRVDVLCELGRGQRVIVDQDERWTYLVESKELIDATSVRLTVRRALPITDINAVRTVIGSEDVKS